MTQFNTLCIAKYMKYKYSVLVSTIDIKYFISSVVPDVILVILNHKTSPGDTATRITPSAGPLLNGIKTFIYSQSVIVRNGWLLTLWMKWLYRECLFPREFLNIYIDMVANPIEISITSFTYKNQWRPLWWLSLWRKKPKCYDGSILKIRNSKYL